MAVPGEWSRGAGKAQKQSDPLVAAKLRLQRLSVEHRISILVAHARSLLPAGSAFRTIERSTSVSGGPAD